ncbi:hypothetical protein LWI28_027319 [Acer negundo]|uniref:EXPERA domain-containing protein n=1 Tax=Acer negundo TaxID=4023 RepID=A0AAD5IXE5_ACENE|nr:hypothetical protein LWI28_027319 [Acer negundo]KAK4846598.1 hypothetical protein QYF36_019689 [Acer negundo]
MGALVKLIDAILFLFFVVMALAAPLIDSQMFLSPEFYPSFLVDLKQWYTTEYGDYLFAEKPHFFVGVVWLELLFLWPLSIVNIFGILCSKPWFNTTCLIYGVSVATSMTAVLAELMGSGKASEKLMMMYSPFMGLGVLAFLRGLIPCSSKTGLALSKRPALPRKKRA